MAAALPIKPIFEVFSRKCGVSETTDAGIAIAMFFLFNSLAPFVLLYGVLLKS
jgi:hypothetical protein